MNESLLQKLERMQKDIDALKLIKPPKQLNYDEALLSIKEDNNKSNRQINILSEKQNKDDIKITALHDINKDLNKSLSNLNDKFNCLNKEIELIKNKKVIKAIDYSEDIKSISDKVFNVKQLIDKNNSKETKVETKIIHKDHTKELLFINNEISAIKNNSNKKQDIDIKSEVEKVVNIAYVTNLYRNK